jgi:hypothetical protein
MRKKSAMKRLLPLCCALVLLAHAPAAGALEAGPAAVFQNLVTEDKVPFSFAISGGISLVWNGGGLWSSVGLGPGTRATWREWEGRERVGWGWSAFAGFLGEKIRVTVGVRSLDEDDFPCDRGFLTIGITEIPNLAYWIGKRFGVGFGR